MMPYGRDYTDERGEPLPDLLAGLRDGAWLDAQDFPPLRYAVPPIVPEGSVLLVGPPKAGKSFFVEAAGLAVAAGGRMLGLPVGEARPVLLLALEDGDRRIQERCRQLMCGEPIPKRFNYLTRVMPGRLLDTIAAWLETYGDDAPLVILDTLGRAMPPALPGESAYGRDYRIGAAIKRLADEHPGTTLLSNHHDRKAAADDFVDAVSGTHGLAGAADTVIVLNRPRNEPAGVLRITGRDVAEAEYAVRFLDGGVWVLDGHDLDEAAARARTARLSESLGDRSAGILAVVANHPEGVRAADVAAEAGVAPGVAKDYLARLERGGRIERPVRGLYTPVASVATVAPAPLNATDATEATGLWELHEAAKAARTQA